MGTWRMKQHNLNLVFGLVLGIGVACSEGDDKTNLGNQGGQTASGGQGGGDTSGGRATGGASDGGAALGGGSNSEGGAGSAGAPSDGGFAGQGRAGNGNGNGGSSGAPTVSAGAAGEAGAPGEAGAGGVGGAGGDDRLLRGPVKADQAPLVVRDSSATALPMDYPVFNMDGEPDYYIAGIAKGSAHFSALDDSLKTIWSLPLDTTYPGAAVDPQQVSTSVDGASVLFGSSNPDAPSVGGREAFVVKINYAGKTLWKDAWGSTGHDDVTATGIANNGGVVSAGTSTGQVPENPASVAKGMWIAWHELDGRRAFHKQYSNASIPNQVLIDSNITAIHVIGDSNWVKVNLSGVEQLRVDIKSMVHPKAALSKDEKSMYLWGQTRFEKYSATTGVLERAWEFEGERRAVVDPGQTEWTGLGQGGNEHAYVAVGKSSFYITGTYTNTYRNGPSPRPTTRLPFIGKYDMDGRRLWFQEIAIEADDSNGENVFLQGLLLDEEDNPILGLFNNEAVAQNRKGYVIKLDSATGAAR